MEDISGKTVVITGASSGFGRGAALEFARLGANVVLAARRDDLLEEVARECRARSAGAWAVPTDVSRREDMENLARTALSEAGWIDVWINNAGIGAIGRFEDIPLDVHEQVLATNLLGTFYGSWVAWRAFLQRGRGILINVSSELGVHTVPYYSSYAASKHGIVGLCQTLRQELKLGGPEDVHVCLVMPTAHDTPFFDHVANYSGREVQAPSPLHDPREVVDALVALARNPKDEKIVGADGIAKVLMKRLTPDVSLSVAARQMHSTQYEDVPPAGSTPGAVHEPMPEGAEVEGHRR